MRYYQFLIVKNFLAGVLYSASARITATIIPTTNCPMFHGTLSSGTAQFPYMNLSATKYPPVISRPASTMILSVVLCVAAVFSAQMIFK